MSNRGRFGFRGNKFRSFRNRFRGRNQSYTRRQVTIVPIEENTQDELNILNDSINKSSKSLTVLNCLPSCPYVGWILYFPFENYDSNLPINKEIEVFKKFLKLESINIKQAELRKYALVDYHQFISNSIIKSKFDDIAKEFQSCPDKFINEMSLALHSLIFDDKSDTEKAEGRSIYISVRIINFAPILYKCGLKANQLGRFIAIQGTIVRIGQVKPVCTRINFRCISCNNEQVLVLSDGYRFAIPTKCISRLCRSKTFEPLKDSESTWTIDYQVVRLQETNFDLASKDEANLSGVNNNSNNPNKSTTFNSAGGSSGGGGIPRNLNCVLIRELVDCCVPGDEVIISGIVVAESALANPSTVSSNSNQCLFNLVLHVNSISRLREKNFINNNNTSSSIQDNFSHKENSLADAEFSVKELYAIEAIHAEPNLFRLLSASLSPNIYGHELVKASLLLALFGGSTKYANDPNQVSIRGNCHVLIVGDPGLGKSQMLQSACAIAPRSVYVCGSTSSSAGLTVTFAKDSSSDSSLEAGALLISDQGCCCIDEFDKMTNQQHSSLLEAMEQQCISIAKAGIVCTLSARTSILAAANPATGHYDKSKTVSENLKMSAPLLSRFDLIFIMLDRPNEILDSKLSKHVLSLHTRKSMSTRTSQIDSKSFESIAKDPDSSIIERLSYSHNEEPDAIPPQLLRKYIAYARKYVHPKLSPEATEVLQNFYISLRKRRHSMDGTPITTRQLESLIRLTEARARTELRELATKQDALDVKELMLESMLGIYSDEFGIMNFSRSQGGRGMSKSQLVKKLIKILQTKAERSGNSMFSYNNIKDLATSINISCTDVEQIISSLNQQGFLLKRGPKIYQLLTTGF